jgi:hypothetical protein
MAKRPNAEPIKYVSAPVIISACPKYMPWEGPPNILNIGFGRFKITITNPIRTMMLAAIKQRSEAKLMNAPGERPYGKINIPPEIRRDVCTVKDCAAL